MVELQNTMPLFAFAHGHVLMNYTLDDPISKKPTARERIEFLRSLYKKPVDDFYNTWFPHILKQRVCGFKDTTLSTSLRVQGNDAYFNNKDLVRAHELYTLSIAMAPLDSEELALGFANRAVILKAEGRCEDALEDIGRALKLPYPARLLHKLLQRQAVCFRDLGRAPESAACFTLAVESIENSTLPAGEKHMLLTKIKVEREMPKMARGNILVSYHPTPPILNYGKSIEVPSASLAVKIEYDEKYGRHLVATRDIELGSVLLVEPWYARVLKPECRLSHCSHCLAWCRILLPCHTCNWAMFCSESCRHNALAKYHKAECEIFSCMLILEVEKPNMQLLIRALATAGFANLERYLKEEKKDIDDRVKNNPRLRGFTPEGIYDCTSIYALCGLQSRVEFWDSSRLIYYTLPLMMLRLCLEGCGYAVSEELLALMMHIYAALDSNQIGVEEVHLCEEGKQIGEALFLTGMLASHSCNSNLRAITSGDLLVMVTDERVSRGEQLTGAYVDQYFNTPKKERQEALQTFHFFTCDCEACTGDWPLLKDLPKKGINPEPGEKAPMFIAKTRLNLLHLHLNAMADMGRKLDQTYLLTKKIWFEACFYHARNRIHYIQQ